MKRRARLKMFYYDFSVSRLFHFLFKQLFHIHLIKFYEVFSIILISFWVNRLSQEHIGLSLAIDYRKFLIYLFSLMAVLFLFVISSTLRTIQNKAINDPQSTSVEKCYGYHLKNEKNKLLILLILFFTFSIAINLL